MLISHRDVVGPLLVALIAGAGCSSAERPAAQHPAAGGQAGTGEAWILASTARIDVGDRDESDSVVFGSVLDARVLPSGLLAVADGGAFAVRFFDGEGRLVRSVGRRGRGPAEFNGGMQFMDAAGDSIAVWDAGQSRWTLVSSESGGTRQLTTPLPVPVWLHAGMEIRSALPAPPAWVPARLGTLSAADPALRLAHLDETGVLWVRTEPTSGEWRAYTDTTASVGALHLPAGERLLHISRDAVVSLAADSVGLERVVVRTLTRGPHASPSLVPTATVTVDRGARDRLMAAMRGAVIAQEMHFAEHEGYTAVADSLTVEMPEGTALRITEVNRTGWRGIGYVVATGFSCGMVIGRATPAGWTEAEVRCGW